MPSWVVNVEKEGRAHRANGTIGTVLRRGLSDFEIVPLDFPDADVRDLATVVRLFTGCSAVIHLAWDLKTDNWDTGKISSDNALMTYNVYRACSEADVPRAIMASSVHADRFMQWKEKELMTPDGAPTPINQPLRGEQGVLGGDGEILFYQGLGSRLHKVRGGEQGQPAYDRQVGPEAGVAQSRRLRQPFENLSDRAGDPPGTRRCSTGSPTTNGEFMIGATRSVGPHVVTPWQNLRAERHRKVPRISWVPVKEKTINAYSLLYYPQFDDFRADPRFKEILREANIEPA